jgi:hypothetical protein
VSDDLVDRVRDEVGQLTDRPPEEYTGARDARVKQLRTAGDRELAAALAKQRKPTLPAWAADQLAHRHGDVLDQLFAAADEVRDAHAEGDTEAVRAATRRFTAEVRRARQLAGDRLQAHGANPDPHLDDVEATLLAAAAGGDVAAQLRSGALTRPAPSPGFAALDAIVAGDRGAGAGARAAPTDTDTAAARRAELEARRGELTEDLDAVTARRDEAARDAADARQDAERHRRQAAEADADATRAEDERARLDDEVSSLRRRLDDVEAELDA